MSNVSDMTERRQEEREEEEASLTHDALRAVCYEAISDEADAFYIIGTLDSLKLEIQLNYLVTAE